MDSDGDGIFDCADACPYEPGLVSDNGCSRSTTTCGVGLTGLGVGVAAGVLGFILGLVAIGATGPDAIPILGGILILLE